MKNYKISERKLNIISILIAMVLYIPAYFIQTIFMTIDSLVIILSVHALINILISLKLSEIQIKY